MAKLSEPQRAVLNTLITGGIVTSSLTHSTNVLARLQLIDRRSRFHPWRLTDAGRAIVQPQLTE